MSAEDRRRYEQQSPCRFSVSVIPRSCAFGRGGFEIRAIGGRVDSGLPTVTHDLGLHHRSYSRVRCSVQRAHESSSPLEGPDGPAWTTFTLVLLMSFMKKGARSTTSAAPPTGFSLFDSATVVTGDLETGASLRIDGRVDGNVRRADVVVLGVGASMSGDIHAREVVIGGTLNGTVYATDRVELQATAIVTGDLVTQSVLVQEGGVVNGRVLMRPPEMPIPSSGSRTSTSGAAPELAVSHAAKPAPR